MSTISLRLPDSLHRQLRGLARQEEVSINQFVTTALVEKLSALMTDDYLAARANRADHGKFERALSRVADAPTEEHDKL